MALLGRLPPVHAPAGFVDRVVETAYRPSWPRRVADALFRPLRVKLPLEAAAVVLVGISALYVYQHAPEVQQVARQETREAPASAPSPAPPPPPSTTSEVGQASPASDAASPPKSGVAELEATREPGPPAATPPAFRLRPRRSASTRTSRRRRPRRRAASAPAPAPGVEGRDVRPRPRRRPSTSGGKTRRARRLRPAPSRSRRSRPSRRRRADAAGSRAAPAPPQIAATPPPEARGRAGGAGAAPRRGARARARAGAVLGGEVARGGAAHARRRTRAGAWWYPRPSRPRSPSTRCWDAWAAPVWRGGSRAPEGLILVDVIISAARYPRAPRGSREDRPVDHRARAEDASLAGPRRSRRQRRALTAPPRARSRELPPPRPVQGTELSDSTRPQEEQPHASSHLRRSARRRGAAAGRPGRRRGAARDHPREPAGSHGHHLQREPRDW